MSGRDDLVRCLGSLREQRAAPPFEVTVVCDPAIDDLDDVRRRFPEARIVSNTGQRSPLELASRALRDSEGDVVLMTKDYCVPGPDWVRVMAEALGRGRAAVGGRVEIERGASATDWAYYFIDFHRYAGPAVEGPVPSLTICNVAYSRRALEAVRACWEREFVEAAVNGALRERFGSLWMAPASEVTLTRRLELSAAVRERYAFGRLFACSRLAACSTRQRVLYAVFAPGLPILLLGRMLRAAARSPRHSTALLRAWVPLVLMVMGRSWGEWLAYVTGRPPRSLVAAN
jgi:hypothetical protein